MERVQLDIEFLFRASPTILYQFLTTPACLVRWFCDGVDIQGDYYTFSWRGADEVAEMVDDIEEERIKFKWLDADEDEFLEFRISKSPVTDETILEITDFCDSDEVDDIKQLWESQVKTLKKEMGGG
ncbi:MAG TPA: START-like domain-containing protein [Saprospiraceae bacterium]|nr:START-like domain-containing protein [Saprospiraceae bacterium]